MSSGDQHSLEDNDEKKKKRFKNREEAVRFYATGVSLGLLLGSFTVFVFLIPFVLDPALATLQGDFSPAAAECRVVSSVYILGVSRCGWASCREGCTKSIHECHQVEVEYTAAETNTTHTARLFITVQGCGYPPEVDCGSWWREHSVNSSVVRCYYSRASPGLAVTHVDPGTAATRLGLGLALPALTCAASAAVLVILHAKCCRHLMDRRKRDNVKQHSHNSSFTKVPKTTRVKRNKEHKKPPEVLPLYERALDNFEDYGRTNSRENLLPGRTKPKRSWRRNTADSERN